MKKRFCLLTGAVTLTALLVVVAGVEAETCRLEIKKIDRSQPPGSPLESLLRAALPQWFFAQLGGPEGKVPNTRQKGAPEFSTITKKEPAEYESPHPFRGVARLGSRYYGFVLDAGPPGREEGGKSGDAKDVDEKTATKSGKPAADSRYRLPLFTRLYFDFNHNGDLTDDEVVVVEEKSVQKMGTNRTISRFHCVDVTLDIGGRKVDYAFALSVDVISERDFAHASVRLEPAAYREGEMTLDGRRYRVVLTDLNSNGVFNDSFEVDEHVDTFNGVVSEKWGDLLFLIDLADGDSAQWVNFPWIDEFAPHQQTDPGWRQIL